MQITLYKLLGMIEMETQPYSIKFHGFSWKWDNNSKDYYNIHYKKLFDGALSGILTLSLNDNVEILDGEFEILEEPKGIPEKMMMCTSGIMSYEAVEHIITELKDKINEIIDYLESKSDSND